MKKLAVLTLIVCLIFSCTPKDPSLVGTWLLTGEILNNQDMKDGFKDVTSTRTLVFKEDGTLSSNGNLCNMMLESLGTYTAKVDTKTRTITPNPERCSMPATITYAIEKGHLALYFECIEVCAQRYTKFKDPE